MSSGDAHHTPEMALPEMEEIMDAPFTVEKLVARSKELDLKQDEIRRVTAMISRALKCSSTRAQTYAFAPGGGGWHAVSDGTITFSCKDYDFVSGNAVKHEFVDRIHAGLQSLIDAAVNIFPDIKEKM